MWPIRKLFDITGYWIRVHYEDQNSFWALPKVHIMNAFNHPVRGIKVIGHPNFHTYWKDANIDNPRGVLELKPRKGEVLRLPARRFLTIKQTHGKGFLRRTYGYIRSL